MKLISRKTAQALRESGIRLSADVRSALQEARSRQGLTEPGRNLLEAVEQNLQIADSKALPMCQDTGMVIAFIGIGNRLCVEPALVEQALQDGVEMAYREGRFRKSMVTEPIFERTNSQTNLPALCYLSVIEGEVITMDLMLKGFGSENCSSLSMLNPTEGADGVVKAVVEAVRKAGGKPCPPIVVGVGVGSSADGALVLSKRALLRPVGSSHPDPRYAQLEERIRTEVEALEIGPGGFKGSGTVLSVMVEHAPTHIAGMPVGVTISCWADRKAHITISREELS